MIEEGHLGGMKRCGGETERLRHHVCASQDSVQFARRFARLPGSPGAQHVRRLEVRGAEALDFEVLLLAASSFIDDLHVTESLKVHQPQKKFRMFRLSPR